MDIRAFYESIDGLDYYDQIKHNANPHDSLEKILAKYPTPEIWRLFLKTDAYPKKPTLLTPESLVILFGEKPTQEILDWSKKINQRDMDEAKKAFEKYSLGADYFTGMFNGFKTMIGSLDKNLRATDLENIHHACTRDIKFTGLKEEHKHGFKDTDTIIPINYNNTSLLGMYQLLERMKEDADFAIVPESTLKEGGTLSRYSFIHKTNLDEHISDTLRRWSHLDTSGKIKTDPDSEFPCFQRGAPFDKDILLQRAQVRLALRLTYDGYMLVAQNKSKYSNASEHKTQNTSDQKVAFEVQKQTDKIIDQYQKQITASKNDVDLILDAIVECMHQLQFTRPFYTANSRTLMIFMNGLLLQNNLPMAIMKDMNNFLAYGKSEMKQALIEGMKNFLKVYQKHPESLSKTYKTETLFVGDDNQRKKYVHSVKALLNTVANIKLTQAKNGTGQSDKKLTNRPLVDAFRMIDSYTGNSSTLFQSSEKPTTSQVNRQAQPDPYADESELMLQRL